MYARTRGTFPKRLAYLTRPRIGVRTRRARPGRSREAALVEPGRLSRVGLVWGESRAVRRRGRSGGGASGNCIAETRRGTWEADDGATYLPESPSVRRTLVVNACARSTARGVSGGLR